MANSSELILSTGLRSRGALQVARNLVTLTKPRITTLVLATEAAGATLARVTRASARSASRSRARPSS